MIGDPGPATARVCDVIGHLAEVETWAPVEGWPAYAVSSWGRIARNGKVLKPAETHGYLVVTLSDRERVKTARLHRLVIETFWGPPPFDGAMVAHNDGDQRNNRIGNLRWASALENQADRVRHSTRTRGSEVFGSKLTEEQIPEIRRRIASGETYPTIADSFGVSVSTISLIKQNRIWTHV